MTLVGVSLVKSVSGTPARCQTSFFFQFCGALETRENLYQRSEVDATDSYLGATFCVALGFCPHSYILKDYTLVIHLSLLALLVAHGDATVHAHNNLTSETFTILKLLTNDHNGGGRASIFSTAMIKIGITVDRS
jgi:hypothetical protein